MAETAKAVEFNERITLENAIFSLRQLRGVREAQGTLDEDGAELLEGLAQEYRQEVLDHLNPGPDSSSAGLTEYFGSYEDRLRRTGALLVAVESSYSFDDRLSLGREKISASCLGQLSHIRADAKFFFSEFATEIAENNIADRDQASQTEALHEATDPKDKRAAAPENPQHDPVGTSAAETLINFDDFTKIEASECISLEEEPLLEVMDKMVVAVGSEPSEELNLYQRYLILVSVASEGDFRAFDFNRSKTTVRLLEKFENDGASTQYVKSSAKRKIRRVLEGTTAEFIVTGTARATRYELRDPEQVVEFYIPQGSTGSLHKSAESKEAAAVETKGQDVVDVDTAEAEEDSASTIELNEEERDLLNLAAEEELLITDLRESLEGGTEVADAVVENLRQWCVQNNVKYRLNKVTFKVLSKLPADG